MPEVPPGVMRDLQEVGRDLYQLALVSSHGGSLSIRSGMDLWITGTGTMLGRLQPRHISLVYPDGHHEGPPPSSDTVLHATVYALSGAQAVVHAHPRHAIALSFEGGDRFVPADMEGSHLLKEVPIVDEGLNQVAQIAALMRSHLVVLLRGHGAYARGQTLWEGLHWITTLEESAQVALLRRR